MTTTIESTEKQVVESAKNIKLSQNDKSMYGALRAADKASLSTRQANLLVGKYWPKYRQEHSKSAVRQLRDWCKANGIRRRFNTGSLRQWSIYYVIYGIRPDIAEYADERSLSRLAPAFSEAKDTDIGEYPKLNDKRAETFMKNVDKFTIGYLEESDADTLAKEFPGYKSKGGKGKKPAARPMDKDDAGKVARRFNVMKDSPDSQREVLASFVKALADNERAMLLDILKNATPKKPRKLQTPTVEEKPRQNVEVTLGNGAPVSVSVPVEA